MGIEDTVPRVFYSSRRMMKAVTPVLALLLAAGIGSAADIGSAPGGLELGYLQMYDLQFTAAHKTFADYEQVFPDDPLAPVNASTRSVADMAWPLSVLSTRSSIH